MTFYIATPAIVRKDTDVDYDIVSTQSVLATEAQWKQDDMKQSDIIDILRLFDGK
jgi:hypothetical protein